MSLGMEVGFGPGDIVLDGDPAPLPRKGTESPPQFSALVYAGQTAALIKMPLGTGVGLGLRDTVLDGDPAKGTHSTFSANVLCGQTTGWTKLPLGMEVGRSPGNSCSIRTQLP